MVGLTWSPLSSTTFTADAYQIGIDDRIVLTGGFTSDDPDIGSAIEALGVVEARFFTNAIDTKTTGLDLTVSNFRQAGAGQLVLQAALNLNNTEVERINTAPGLEGKEDIYFNTRERLFVEGSAPEHLLQAARHVQPPGEQDEPRVRRVPEDGLTFRVPGEDAAPVPGQQTLRGEVSADGQQPRPVRPLGRRKGLRILSEEEHRHAPSPGQFL